jgi:two-component system chemotaxis response regulator CheB
MDSSDIQRYRCHTGHSYTAGSLLASQAERIEETLWVSLRMFEERKNLLTNLAQKASASGAKRQYLQRRHEAEIHIERVRKMLRATK